MNAACAGEGKKESLYWNRCSFSPENPGWRCGLLVRTVSLKGSGNVTVVSLRPDFFFFFFFMETRKTGSQSLSMDIPSWTYLASKEN